MEASEIRKGHRYIIHTVAGRKLIWVLEVSRDEGSTVARISKLRAASRRMTQAQWVTFTWLVLHGIRKPGDADRDLLRLATAVAYAEASR